MAVSNVMPSYCASASQSASYEWISKVKVGTFTNSSTATTYSDFTSKTITLATGSHSVTLTPTFGSGSYTEVFRIWIDLDGNGDFAGTGERVFSASKKSAVTGTITIPATAKKGQTRMRVSMRYSTAPSACGTFDYGEVEDYTVIVQ